MSSPIAKVGVPNTTQIPNLIFDHWIPILKPATVVVLLIICRKTFGWHRTSDEISKSQLCKLSGMSKNTVQMAIEELESHSLLIKIQKKGEYGQLPNAYALNIKKPEYFPEEGDQNLGGGRSKFDPGVGQNLTQGREGATEEDQGGGVGQNLTPQKKDILGKENDKGIAQSATPPHHADPDIDFSFFENKFINIQKKDIDAWKEIYSCVNVEIEIKRMNEWILSNQSKSRQKKKWRAFINSWLKGENEKEINRQAYRSRNSSPNKPDVPSRHQGLQQDTRPNNPSRTKDYSNC